MMQGVGGARTAKQKTTQRVWIFCGVVEVVGIEPTSRELAPECLHG